AAVLLNMNQPVLAGTPESPAVPTPAAPTPATPDATSPTLVPTMTTPPGSLTNTEIIPTAPPAIPSVNMPPASISVPGGNPVVQ
ncbi:MAG: hypothetical protein VKJ86_13105, partial [Synechococcus sp.]|nr:hypothetical protein [Synechococcus sp.]